MALSVSPSRQVDPTVLTLVGELDVMTSPTLADAIVKAIADGATDIVLDATGLAFCDSTGLSAFAAAVEQLGSKGGRLVIAGAPRIVRRVLEVSGLDEALLVAEDVADAHDRLPATA
ncbi:STAS domain-containing protein [Hamadaea sp. NPDC050747]|uniref:STAS domain-containing protein n=1 Tax=Hamadaea sp. NPDC050747 TaxID=3155789 RepID=UPI0033F3AC91